MKTRNYLTVLLLLLMTTPQSNLVAETPTSQTLAPSTKDSVAPLTLKIIATVPPETGLVFLAGNQPSLGSWKADGLLMEGEGTKRTATITAPSGETVEFKLTQGSWDTEALNADFTVPANHVVRLTENAEYTVSVNQFRSSKQDVPYPDPARYQPDINVYMEADVLQAPPMGAVLAIGSSNLLGWHPTIARDLAPLTIIPRGFGGSMMNDYIYFKDSVILNYNPRAIILYGGSNDLGHGVFPETVFAKFKELNAIIREKLPQCRIYILGPIPSPSREGFRERTDQLNALLKEAADADPLLTYVDVTTPLLDENGKARLEFFVEDQLHLNAKGYEAWAAAVRPIVVEAEKSFELQPAF